MSGSDNRRKHRSQMRASEIDVVERLVHDQTKWTIGKHAHDRIDAKGIRASQVYDVLKSGYVIEINHNADLCVCFRKEYGDTAICVVVSLATRWVVTAWTNKAHDTHETLDQSKYQWKVDVRSVMEAFA